jgi:hypothetical protein
MLVLPEVATYLSEVSCILSTFTTLVNSSKYLSTRNVRLQLVQSVCSSPFAPMNSALGLI